MDELFSIVLTVVLLLFVAFARPERAHAPPGWHFEGIRPSGETTLRHAPPPNCGEPVPPYDQPCPRDERAIGTRIFCTGGALPIVVDSQTVGCQRGGWSDAP